MYTRIAASRIEFGGAKDKENARLTKQLFNPFILLYRGVELVMVSSSLFISGHYK